MLHGVPPLWWSRSGWSALRGAHAHSGSPRGSCLLCRWHFSLGEMAELPQAVVLRQFWFGRVRGPVDEAAQREAGPVEPLALLEARHVEQLRVGPGQPG